MTHEETCRELRGHAMALKAQMVSLEGWACLVQETLDRRYPSATGLRTSPPGELSGLRQAIRTDMSLDIRNLAVARSRAPGQAPAAAPDAR